ncbi:hypothetical protein ABZS66_46750 [Dactylosporangium sp. NPDC005572]|uniref:hypothetical protein n=1 Tax=Dactylosporangium sp. NPDC005572 TaxID=3156889 RepID=UPI0033A4029C
MVNRLRTLLRDRGLLGSALTTIVGAGMITAAWALSGASFLPDVLLQVGSSLVLVIPLVQIGWMIESRLRRAEQRTASMADQLAGVREAVSRLDQVGTATRALIESSRESWDALLAAVTEAPTQQNVARLVERATSAGLLAPSGLRVRFPGTELRLRYRLDEDLVLTLERVDGSPVHQLTWSPGTAPEVIARDLAETAVVLRLYPGDTEFDASALLGDLVAAVRHGVTARHGEHPFRLGALVEIPGRQWAIAEDGLYCLERDYRIPLARTGTGEDWRTHMLTKSWVDRDDFLTAWGIAFPPGGR